MTKDRWRSIDGHFQDGAGRVLQSVLPIKEAKKSDMTDCNLLAVWFPRTHDQKLLWLCWSSLSRLGRERFVLILPIKVANTCIMYNNGRINFKWPDLYDLQLLMLGWCSFSHGCINNMQSFDWHSPSFTLFWLPFWHNHLLSSWSLSCFLIIHGDIY